LNGIKIKKKSIYRGNGITFEQASYVIADKFALNKFDDEHSEDEDRWVLLGKSLNETLLLIRHTFRNDDGTEFVRIISARKATKKKKQTYQKRCPK